MYIGNYAVPVWLVEPENRVIHVSNFIIVVGFVWSHTMPITMF